MKKVTKTSGAKKSPPAAKRGVKRVAKRVRKVRPVTVKGRTRTPAKTAPTSAPTIPPILPAATAAEEMPVVPVEVLQAFFQKRAAYYIRRWEQYRQKQFPGWNWAACLMGPWWFFYRRMPWYGVGFLALGAIAFIPKVGFLALGVNVLLGFLGNELYLSEFKQAYLAQGAAKASTEPGHWQRTGGVKQWALLAMVAVFGLTLAGLGLIAMWFGTEAPAPPENAFRSSRYAPVLPARPSGQGIVDQANGDACIQAGRIAREQGKLGKALYNYNQALEYNPKLAIGFLKRGEIYAQRGDWLQAESDFKRAVELDPALQGQVDKILGRKP